jgi:tetratricopeptide (TPR) repeat protein
LGIARAYQGDLERANALFEESLELYREAGDGWGIAEILNNLGLIAGAQGQIDGARVLLEESLKVRRELGDKRGIAMSLFNLGEGLLDDDFERTEVMIEEGLRLWRALGDKTFVSTRSWKSLFRGAYAGSRTGRPARPAKELRRRGEHPHYRAARRAVYVLLEASVKVHLFTPGLR